MICIITFLIASHKLHPDKQHISSQSVQLLSHIWLCDHGLQHVRPSCPSQTPGVYSNSCSLNRQSHPTISSSVVSFSSRLQSCPASGSFAVTQFFTIRWQSIGVAASASVLPNNSQDTFRMDWLELLAVQGTLKSLLQHHSSKASILWLSAFFTVQLSHPHTTTGKDHSLD